MNEDIMQWNIREAREPIKTGAVVMDGWELRRLLGRGGYGSVWLAEKSLFGVKAQSAVKIINIPHEPGEIDAMRSDGLSKEEIQTELRHQVENAIREIRAILELRNQSAVVSCENFDVIQYEDDETWDIFIRMELLTPLTERAKANMIQTADIVKMGITIADLLAVCEEKKILHRDIKPSNIFVDENGRYKLGDFGLSRAVSGAYSVHTKGVGTEAYMAPEVFNGDNYDHRADIYSLGLVMYWLLNQQRLPFLENNASRDKAISIRLSGEALPKLPGVSRELNKIIQKACNSNPKDRWQSAEEFSDALKQIENRAIETKKHTKINHGKKKWIVGLFVFLVLVVSIGLLYRENVYLRERVTRYRIQIDKLNASLDDKTKQIALLQAENGEMNNAEEHYEKKGEESKRIEEETSNDSTDESSSRFFSYDSTFSGINTQLVDDLATRSGPSTSYTGCGSYQMKGTTVIVCSRKYDNNKTLWVEIEFYFANRYRRVWTGADRLNISDSQLDLLPEEDDSILGHGEIIATTTPRYGPGSEYATHDEMTLYSGNKVVVVREQNGYYLTEYNNTDGKVFRSWISVKDVLLIQNSGIHNKEQNVIAI